MKNTGKRLELARLLDVVRKLEKDGDREWADRLQGRADAVIAQLVEVRVEVAAA